MAVIGLLVAALIWFLYQPDIPRTVLKEKYASDKSKFIDIDGLQVHFRDETSNKGNPNNNTKSDSNNNTNKDKANAIVSASIDVNTDSLPLVLIHGTSSSLHTWDACTELLKDRYRIIRFDLPGFGLTGPNADNDYSIDNYVFFVSEFLNKMGIKKCHIAGNSLGGNIAWRFAERYPQQVGKLILLNSAGYPIEKAKGSLGFNIAQTPIVNNIMKFITPRSLVQKSLFDAYADDAKVTDALVERYHTMACAEGSRTALIRRFQYPREDRYELVKNVQTPTLIIWGDQDQLIPVANAQRFAQDLPNDTLVILRQMGHVPMEEVPEVVAKYMSDFLEK